VRIIDRIKRFLRVRWEFRGYEIGIRMWNALPKFGVILGHWSVCVLYVSWSLCNYCRDQVLRCCR